MAKKEVKTDLWVHGLLPVTDQGEIDFARMAAYMKAVERGILDPTLKVFKESG